MRPSSAGFLEDIREAAQTVREITSGKKFADYSLVKHDLVWSVIENQVPRLIAEVEGRLAAASS